MTTQETTPKPLAQVESDPLSLTLKRAYLLLEHGDLTLTRRLLDEAIKRHPEEPLPVALRASVEIAAGDCTAAARLLRVAMRRWPEHPAAHVYMAEVHLLSKKFSLARRKIERTTYTLNALDGADPRRVWLAMLDPLKNLCEELPVELIPAPLPLMDEDEP